MMLSSSSRRVFFFVLLFLGLLLAFYFYRKYKVAPGIEQFKLEIIDINNQKGTWEKYKNKKLIIAYYASWCGDCIKELKLLNEVRNSTLSDYAIVCITDEDSIKLKSFADRKNYPFDFYRVSSSFSQMGLHSIPVTYVLDEKGNTIYNKVGAINWKDPAFIDFIKGLSHENK